MKNPLLKRLPRELKDDLGKYLVILLLMVLSIAEVSGFLVADSSMIKAYNESFEKYNIEDGHFTVSQPLTPGQTTAIEKNGIRLTPLYSQDIPLDNDSKLRVFRIRTDIDLVCLMDGSFPEKPGEIAIDRMYADNNKLRVGDTIRPAEGAAQAEAVPEWTITGLVALSDYSTMFENNNDSMFDSVKFGTAVTTPEEFASYPEASTAWTYGWLYENAPENDRQERELAEALLKELVKTVHLEDYIPRYLNQAIVFTGDDMGSDSVEMAVFLYLVILIIAFVFAVTISNTIAKEAGVIGTLRASGYTRHELIVHYMTLPVLVTLFSALVGNILGYTVMKQVNADLYYGSYSLPTYRTVWSAEAFVKTTLVPIIIMLLVDYLILRRKLALTPLQFLRHDLKKSGKKKAVRLSPSLPIFHRFRLRVIFQNMSNYILLFIGVVFANLLLLFGLLFPSVLTHYQDSIGDNLFSNYQYVLTMPASMMTDDPLESLKNLARMQLGTESKNPDAEKYSAYSLSTYEEGLFGTEDILFYGIAPGSRYVDLSLTEEDVYISSAYAEKFRLSPGDTISLHERYEDASYTFTVTGVYDYEGSLAVFMDQGALNRTFGFGEHTFTGYLSDTPVTDIDPSFVGTVIDRDSLTKISRQLMVSMGSMMDVIAVFSVVMSLILVYLLSRIIIEKNAHSISMTKILGYTNGEIGRLYILPTSILMILFVAVTIPIGIGLLLLIYRNVLLPMIKGYLPFYLGADVILKVFLAGVLAYLVVAVLEFRKIRKVPMDEALKNQE